MSVFTFQADVFPYVKGDVIELTDDEKARVDAVAKARKLDTPYVAGAKGVDTVDDSRGADVVRAEAAREAARNNAVDQSAVLESQRTAVAEPANVDALGVLGESPAQVITGTKPVADVEVTNPQEATDPSNPAGAEVKSKKTKAA